MRSNRRRNWLIKRIALGFAVAAFAAPVAQAAVDEGVQVESNAPQIVKGPHDAMASAASTDSGMPRAMPSDYAQLRGDQIELVRSLHRTTGSDIVAADYGMPRALPSDYALSQGDQIEVVRAQPRGTSSDKIEFVRSTQPRSSSPELFGRFSRPNATTGEQVEAVSINWGDAAIGAGLALALVLVGGGAALATRHSNREQTA